MHLRRRSTRLLAVAGVAGAALTAGVPTTASAALKVGVADQNATMFANPLFQGLGNVGYTRLIVPHDVMDKPSSAEFVETANFLNQARSQGVRVLVAFNHTRDYGVDDFKTSRTLPSVSTYTRQVKAFHAQFGSLVESYQPWNEVNSPSQPTYKNPRRAAQFTDAMVKSIRGRKIVGIDALDISNMSRYFKTFYRSLKTRSKIKYWGLHNYGDVNRKRTSYTKSFVKLTRKGEVWLTETGGLKQLCTSTRCSFPSSTSRQKSATDFLFKKLVKVNKRRITRVYIYQFFGQGDDARFDAGLINPDGTKRPAYDVVNRYIR